MLSIYVHIPFCVRRCAYCDFNTYAGMQAYMDDYIDALVTEINRVKYSKFSQKQINTLYFGGGTPSLLTSKNFENIFKAINNTFNVINIDEVTVEANPGAMDVALLKSLKEMGVNRLSIGAQSFEDDELRKLGRIHKSEDIYKSVSDARRCGFENINLDMMFGLPEQNLQTWEKNLRIAVKLFPEHLSLYSLILEEGTPLADTVKNGVLSLPDDDTCADMFEKAIEFLFSENYVHYEISNWSKAGQYPSQHNKQYWYNEPYLGFGAGAHSCIGGMRFENLTGIPDYIQALSNDWMKSENGFSPANHNLKKIDDYTAMQETMMLGLRLVDEGVSEERFLKKHGRSMFEVFSNEISILLDLGLLIKFQENNREGIRLSERGILLGNQVFMRFV